MQDLVGDFPWETIRIVEFEADFTRKHLFAFSLQVFDVTVQEFHALCERRREAILLNADDFLDVFFLLSKFFKVCCTLVDFSNSVNRAFQELVMDAEDAPMTHSATQDAAQNIAAALV